MDWGSVESKLRSIGVDKQPPKLYDDLIIVWEAFNALNSSRLGCNSISFSEIESWLNLNGVKSLEFRQEITHYIRILDNKYLSLIKGS